MTAGNIGTQYDRLPASADDRVVSDRPTREAVVSFFHERYGIPPDTFGEYSFWEKGSGKIWAFAGDAPSPIAVEALGIHVLRTNQRHWKPTTDAVQRFGRDADTHVVALTREQAIRFWRGETQSIDASAGYVIVTHPIAGEQEPLGVGLSVRGELRSQIPKGRQRDFGDERA